MPNWHLKPTLSIKKESYMTKKEEIIEISTDPEIEITNVTVSSLIHIIRGKQVVRVGRKSPPTVA